MTGPGDFWSRRRAAVAEEERDRERSAEETARAGPERRALDEKPDAEALAELNLPDPDALGPGDDFSAFMAKTVPDRLRRRALRRLWISNPILANLDELVDYGEDFTDAATVVENLQTAYRVGKGMLEHVQAQAEAAEADASPGAADGADETGERAEPGPSSVETGADAPETLSGPTDEGREEEAAAEPRPMRHMRFAFVDEDADDGRAGESVPMDGRWRKTG